VPLPEDIAAAERAAGLAGWEAADDIPVTLRAEEWLQPYTDKTLEKLAADGIRRVAVINPGFVSDCLETLEEIAVQNAETSTPTWGEHFSHIPCLNDSPAGMRVIRSVVLRELQGWI
jgi:ferrochelatase